MRRKDGAGAGGAEDPCIPVGAQAEAAAGREKLSPI